MSTSLFDLTGEYRDAMARLAELDLPPEVVSDTLESLSGELEVKALNVAAMALSMEATADAIKAHRTAQKEREDAIRARAERLREYLANCLGAAGIERVEGPALCLSWRKSSAVEVFEPGLLPAQFWRQKPPPEPEPDKKLIADRIKAGIDVPGARIEERRNLQVK